MKTALIKRITSLSKDFIYNIVASLVLTGVMQLVVYPVLATHFSETQYGVLLTVMGVVNTLIVAMGNTLNNTRLIVNADYERENECGDFSLLLLFACIIGGIVGAILSRLFFGITIIETILLSLTIILGIVKSYYCVHFRLILNFKKTLLQNLSGGIGYGVGLLLCIILKCWPLPFLFAELAQTIYVLYRNPLLNEKRKRTRFFGSTVSRYIILIATGAVSTLVIYLDRVLLYPLIGANAVSIYTVASVFGKTLGIVMTPISGVMLGYFAQKDYQMTKKRFWLINGLSLACGTLFMLFSLIFSPAVTRFLYPTLFDSSKEYLFLANLAAMIGAVGSMTQAAVLKFAPTYLQIIKEVVYSVAYIVLGVIFLNAFGLTGFCVSAIIANIAKLLVLYLIGYIYIGKENERKHA